MARKGDNSKALKAARKTGAAVHELTPPERNDLVSRPAKAGTSDADSIAQAQRIRTILQYRVMGATLEQIGQKFDLTPGRVSQIITDAINQLPKQAAEDVKRLELERLDAMQFALWSPALKGDIGAITTILSIMTRRARYLGLDEPEAIDAAVVTNAANDDARQALLGRLLTIKERMSKAPPANEHAVLPPPTTKGGSDG